ncbi:MAG TPA: hypothetical protein VM425_18175 [Myxococcota bacterium]|nr:hypothetical protein [Myxococcota bacterium]
MTSKTDKGKLHRPTESAGPSADSHIREVDDVIIQVTQVFCHNGHNLIFNKDELFDGQPGISLLVSDAKSSGAVIISPFHGDHGRRGKQDFKDGEHLTIACPICKEELKPLVPCSCSADGQLVKLYLTPDLSDDKVVGLCNVWGCHRSKVFDQAQLLSAYVED